MLIPEHRKNGMVFDEPLGKPYVGFERVIRKRRVVGEQLKRNETASWFCCMQVKERTCQQAQQLRLNKNRKEGRLKE